MVSFFFFIYLQFEFEFNHCVNAAACSFPLSQYHRSKRQLNSKWISNQMNSTYSITWKIALVPNVAALMPTIWPVTHRQSWSRDEQGDHRLLPLARLHSLWRIQFPSPMNFQSGWHLQINPSLAIVLFILVYPSTKITLTSLSTVFIPPYSEITFLFQISFIRNWMMWCDTASLSLSLSPPFSLSTSSLSKSLYHFTRPFPFQLPTTNPAFKTKQNLCLGLRHAV